MKDINNKSVLSNMIWRFFERTGAQFIQIIVQIVLARILSPDDYGTIGLIIVFANIFQVFVDSGLANALIQKKDADDLDFSSVFYFNVVFCIILYGVLFISAPFIATFYQNSSLVSLIRVLCLTIVISGLKNVQQAYVSRTLQFKKFFYSTLIGTILSAVVGITMAYTGFGVWALVAQKLTNLAVDTLVLWLTISWRPKKMFSFIRLKELVDYGWKILASTLLNTVYENLRQMVIGKVYSEADLAYYNQGEQYPSVIVKNVLTSIDSVLFPAMSSVQDDKSRVKAMTTRAIKVSTYVMAPIMVGLIVIAKPLVTIMLTEKWLPCVFFLQTFSFNYIFQTIHTANLNAIKALGRSDVFLKLEIEKKIVGLVILFVCVPIGLRAIAISLLINNVIAMMINSYPNKKLLNYSLFEQMLDVLPNIILAFCMGVVVYLVGLLPINKIILIGLQIIIGSGVYVLESIIFKNESFMYLFCLLKPFINKKMKRG